MHRLNVFARFGPGTYTITVLESESSTQIGAEYSRGTPFNTNRAKVIAWLSTNSALFLHKDNLIYVTIYGTIK